MRAGLSLLLSMLSLTMLAADIEDRHRSSLGSPLLLSSGWVGWWCDDACVARA